MLLSDRDIFDEIASGDIVIDPFHLDNLQPASYDVHLDDTLLVPEQQMSYQRWWADPIEPVTRSGLQLDPGSDTQPLDRMQLHGRDSYESDKFWLPPGGMALGCTSEHIALHPDSALAADIAGCSSLGRWWLMVHVTAGFVDAGWSGKLTLELVNLSPWWLRLWTGMRIAQLRFWELRSAADRPYAETGHYYGSNSVEPSRYSA